MYEENYLPSRKFFWEVFASLYYNEATQIIEEERERKYSKEEKEKKQVIMVDPSILNELQKVSYFSKSKGRALYNLKSKLFSLPSRKRKWKEVTGLDVDDLEATPFMITKLNKRGRKAKNIMNEKRHLSAEKATMIMTEGLMHSAKQDMPTKFSQQLKDNPFTSDQRTASTKINPFTESRRHK